MKTKKENGYERNFKGRFSGELGWEMVQQFHVGGVHELFGKFSNKFDSEGSPIFLPKLGSVFSITKRFCFENSVFSHLA